MVKTHPRLIDFLSSDWQKNTLILNPADPLEMIRWLRLAGSGEVIDLPAEIEGVSQRIAVAQTGLVIFGPEWLRRGQSLAGELLRWLNDLNRIARWYTIYLAPEPNTIGVIETLLSETGYQGHFRFSPYGVDYYPQLWCAEELIESNMADLCLLIGNPDAFSTKTLARLAGMHTILISPQQPDWNPLLWLPCAKVGIDMSGVYLRVDGIPMQLQSIFLSQRPTISEILSSLAGGVL